MSGQTSLEDTYLVWSNEHQAWWAAPSGYTSSMAEARHFTHAAALAVCLRAIPGTANRMGMLPELPVPLRDVLAFTSAFLADFPDSGGQWA